MSLSEAVEIRKKIMEGVHQGFSAGRSVLVSNNLGMNGGKTYGYATSSPFLTHLHVTTTVSENAAVNNYKINASAAMPNFLLEPQLSEMTPATVACGERRKLSRLTQKQMLEPRNSCRSSLDSEFT